MSTSALWDACFNHLRSVVPSDEFNLWILPLQSEETQSNLTLYAPNNYVLNQVKKHFLGQIIQLITQLSPENIISVKLKTGDTSQHKADTPPNVPSTTRSPAPTIASNLNKHFTLDTYVKGRSNEIASAAAYTVADNPGQSYNPLFIYGDVGLGKTHLMQAIGNRIRQNNPNAQILYTHSERFVTNMITALQRNEMEKFKKLYRGVDALLIDDIQFFAKKERSQEELFHTFNALLDAHQQIILTSDRYPKELDGLDERLKSRFSWGLAVGIEPPELETRVAILLNKARLSQVTLPQEVAFFIASSINSNVRELEGALKRVIANAHFKGAQITIDFAKMALKDLLSIQAKFVTIEVIQQMVSKHYKISITAMTSKRRDRQIARPRQLAMTLAKELTSKSLPEIGAAFGGRDHTTVLHACKTIKKLMESDRKLKHDFEHLLKILSN